MQDNLNLHILLMFKGSYCLTWLIHCLLFSATGLKLQDFAGIRRRVTIPRTRGQCQTFTLAITALIGVMDMENV